MPKKLSFNWSGITENGDGSFTVQGKAARKRLLKEFHKQGLQVRSQKQSDGTYILSGIGERQPHGRRGLPPRIGNRPQSRYPVRGYPPRGIRPQFRRGLPSRPFARPQQAPPRLSPMGLRGSSLLERWATHRAEEKRINVEYEKAKQKAIKQRADAKTQGEKDELNRQLRKQELQRQNLYYKRNENYRNRAEAGGKAMIDREKPYTQSGVSESEQRERIYQKAEADMARGARETRERKIFEDSERRRSENEQQREHARASQRGSFYGMRQETPQSQNIKMNDKPMNSADLEALRQNAE